MISWISSWAQGIVVAVILATILEMILPEGKNKKYVKIVIGIFVLFSILSPVISKLSGKELSAIDFNYEKYFENVQTSGMANSLSQDNEQNIQTLYIQSLKADITSKIEAQGYQVKRLNVDVETSSQTDYGKIHSIHLEIAKKEEKAEEIEKGNNIIAIEPIEEVKIGSKQTSEDKQENKEETLPSTKEVNDLKSYLSTTYGVKKNAIKINQNS